MQHQNNGLLFKHQYHLKSGYQEHNRVPISTLVSTVEIYVKDCTGRAFLWVAGCFFVPYVTFNISPLNLFYCIFSVSQYVIETYQLNIKIANKYYSTPTNSYQYEQLEGPLEATGLQAVQGT